MTAPWVGLKKLDLTETGLFALSKPMLASWSTLEDLSLKNNKTYGDVMHTLVRAHLPSLRGLSLQRFFSYNISHMTSLAFANWSLLQRLDLSSRRFDMQDLVTPHFPHLRSLHLAETGLIAYQAKVLILGRWPELEVLDLDRNCLFPKHCAFVESLVHGQWPLKVLSLRGNYLTCETLEILMRQGWPTLQELHLPDFDFNSMYSGHITPDPLQRTCIHVRELEWFCDCTLRHLTKMTFSTIGH